MTRQKDASVIGTVFLADPETGEPYKAQNTVVVSEGDIDTTFLATSAKQDEQKAATEAVTAKLGTTLQVHVDNPSSSTLPTGAATTAKQDSIVNAVNAVTTALGGDLRVVDGGGSLTVDFASQPLPAGAATSAKQDAIVTELQQTHNVHFDNTTLATTITSGTVDASGSTVHVDNTSLNVAGTVAVSNATFPVTDNGGSLTVDGTVAVSAVGGIVNVSDNGGSLTVDGTVSVNNATFPVTDNGGSLTVDGSVSLVGTSPVSLASVPSHGILLNAADTSAMVQAGNVALPVMGVGGLPVDTTDSHTVAIDNKTPTLGQASMASSTPVVVASNQSSLPVTVGNSTLAVTKSGTWLVDTNAPSLSVSSTATLAVRYPAITSTPQQVKSSAARLHYFDISNPNTSPVYLNIYNALAANVTVGTTLPIFTISVPAGATRSDYMPNSMPLSTAFTVAAVTTVTGNGAPTATILASFLYV